MNHDQHIQNGQDIEKIELVDIEELRAALGAEAELGLCQLVEWKVE